MPAHCLISERNLHPVLITRMLLLLPRYLNFYPLVMSCCRWDLIINPRRISPYSLSPITSRWVIVTATGLNPLTPSQKGNLYGVPLGKTVNNEIGAYLSANYMKDLVTNLTYKGKLDLFSNYKHNPQNIDVYMTNLFSANVFKGLSFNLGLDLVYDDDARIFGKNSNAPRTQFREYIGIGYLKKF